MRYAFIAFIIAWAAPAMAQAMTTEYVTTEKTQTIADYIEDYVDVPRGALDWTLLGKTKEIQAQTKTEDGYDWILSPAILLPL